MWVFARSISFRFDAIPKLLEKEYLTLANFYFYCLYLNVSLFSFASDGWERYYARPDATIFSLQYNIILFVLLLQTARTNRSPPGSTYKKGKILRRTTNGLKLSRYANLDQSAINFLQRRYIKYTISHIRQNWSLTRVAALTCTRTIEHFLPYNLRILVRARYITRMPLTALEGSNIPFVTMKTSRIIIRLTIRTTLQLYEQSNVRHFTRDGDIRNETKKNIVLQDRGNIDLQKDIRWPLRTRLNNPRL